MGMAKSSACLEQFQQLRVQYVPLQSHAPRSLLLRHTAEDSGIATGGAYLA